MVEGSQGFPHIQLKLTTEGRAVLRGGGTKSPQTITNLHNRQGHGSKLKGSLESLIFDWQQDTQEKPEKEQPRRTRRNRRKYLSTWLDWDCSKKAENTEKFLERILKKYDAPEDAEKGDDCFQWTVGKRSKNYGKIDGVSRSAGTLQKDWAIVNSFELTEAFSIAVVGHEGWNNDPEASVPYSLVVSFEAIQADIPIYTLVKAQVEPEIESPVEIQSL